VAWLVPSCLAGHARLCYESSDLPSRKGRNTPENTAKDKSDPITELIRWSIQKTRRIANKMAKRQIQPAHCIVWLFWRRVHQTVASLCHVKSKLQI
jgi:hypothetical protein